MSKKFNSIEESKKLMISDVLFSKIEEILPKGKTILELGSGAGTARLLERWKVYSIENDERFINLYHNNYTYAPIKRIQPRHPDFLSCKYWYDPEMIKREIPEHYDFILIDGPAGFGKNCRAGFFIFFDYLFKNVPMIFDDVHNHRNREVLKRVAEKIQRQYEIYKIPVDKKGQIHYRACGVVK